MTVRVLPEFEGNFTKEPLLNGRQEFRRASGLELRWWQQALAHRESFPANIWFTGDSMTEAFGVTSDYQRWAYLVGRAVQDRFRNGGFGYIPSRHARGLTWPYTSNPDGKNIFTYTGGAGDDATDFGWGFGRRARWYNNAGTGEILVETDRVHVFWTGGLGTGTFTVDIDGAGGYTQNTALNMTLSGRVWDSAVAGAAPFLGTHRVKVTATTGTSIIDGVYPYYTDALTGVHIFEGGHSGHLSTNYDGQDAAGEDGHWADLAYQPHTMSIFTDGVGNGTTTFTSATAAFVDNDIGEYLVWSQVNTYKPTNGVARIVARASGTSVTLDRVIPSASSQRFAINRPQFTDGVTTNASKTLTSATAAFNPWDVGMYVQGSANIPAGTYIARWNSATSVELSAAATASSSSQTIRVLGRQKYWMAPDLLVVEFGINDRTYSVHPEVFKANTRRIVSLASERAAIGFPLNFTQRYTPSVLLVGMWAGGATVAGTGGPVTATSGSAVITSDPDGASSSFDFDPLDVGKTITTAGNTPIPASTTIASVQSARQATLSQNAVASSTAAANIVNRVQSDQMWQRMRTAQFELAAENNWRFFDLYSLGGYIGQNDPYNLTSDFLHPNNHGSRWVADEFDIVITGQPRSAAIPQGVFDNPGEVIFAVGADTASRVLPMDYWGDGSDGAWTATTGGSNTAWATRSGTTWTLIRDTNLTSCTVDSGVTVYTAGYRFIGNNLLTNNGTVQNNGFAGGNGTTGAGGGAGPPGAGGSLAAGAGGGNGGAATLNASGTAGTSQTANTSLGGSGGIGGDGAGSGTPGAAGTVSAPLAAKGILRIARVLFETTTMGASSIALTPAAGGGGGTGTTAAGGGGGGGGAGWCIVSFPVVISTGTISANGGNGGAPSGSSGGGGGGGGGVAAVVSASFTNRGTHTASGGTQGTLGAVGSPGLAIWAKVV